jgi:hypothetical protein
MVLRNLFYTLVMMSMVLTVACSEDDYPVPPASIVPKFTVQVSNDGFAPADVQFTNISIIPDRVENVSYIWNFGDSTSSTQLSPSHHYEAPGVYTVSLVIISEATAEIREYKYSLLIKDPNATGVPVYVTNINGILRGNINEFDIIWEDINITLQGTFSLLVDTVGNRLFIPDLNGNKIVVADLDGKNARDFRTNIGEPSSLAIDYVDNMLYWDTGDGIRRSSLSETNASHFEEVIAGRGNDPEGMVIDQVNRRIYWNEYDGGVWGMNLSGGAVAAIAGGQGGGSIALVNGRLFYDEYFGSGDISLKSINVDGSDVQTVVSGISRLVYGIAYEPTTNKIYWIDRNKNTLSRANLDGSNVEIISNGTVIRGLAFGKLQ